MNFLGGDANFGWPHLFRCRIGALAVCADLPPLLRSVIFIGQPPVSESPRPGYVSGGIAGSGNRKGRGMNRLAILAPLALIPGPTNAAEQNPSDGNGLYENCQSENLTLKVACHQYIIGVVDGVRVAEPEGKPSFGIPPDVRGIQIRDIVIQYLRDNPDKRHWPSSYLIWNALVKVFPPPPRSTKP